jgi:hypothetical protein
MIPMDNLRSKKPSDLIIIKILQSLLLTLVVLCVHTGNINIHYFFSWFRSFRMQKTRRLFGLLVD